MLRKLFRTRPAVGMGRTLYRAVAARARSPALYLDFAAPDTVEGRFEVYVVHLVVLLHRLKGCGAEAAEVAQSVFDAFVRDLDEGLRDMGVGDLSVGKKMRRLGEAVYGRIKSYDLALSDPDPVPALVEVIARTVFRGEAGAGAEALAHYVASMSSALAARPLGEILAPSFAWPDVPWKGPHV